jgi:sec-independent protein translocase protein TatA
MGAFSGWHLLLFALVAVLLFGGSGKISSIMGDFAKGIKSFKKGLADDEEIASRKPEAPKVLEPSSKAGEPAADRSKVG